VAEETGLSKLTIDRALNPESPRQQLVEVGDADDVVTERPTPSFAHGP